MFNWFKKKHKQPNIDLNKYQKANYAIIIYGDNNDNVYTDLYWKQCDDYTAIRLASLLFSVGNSANVLLIMEHLVNMSKNQNTKEYLQNILNLLIGLFEESAVEQDSDVHKPIIRPLEALKDYNQ